MPADTSSSPDGSIRGRGAAENPGGRFETLVFEPDADACAPGDDGDGDGAPGPRTRFLRDASASILSTNDSPDVPFELSANPYRGCEHGCVYCYARPTHEYLGFSAGLDFETTILVKERAPALLRGELAARRYRPRVLALSGVTDPYQPIERRLRLTRGCLEVLRDCRHPVIVVTKSRLVARDRDLLADLSRWSAAAVFVSVTTLDGDLARRLEPRASHPERRLEAIRELAAAGIPVGVLAAPIIPGLNDREIPAILAAAAAAGARHAGWTLLRLPHGVKDLFASWLDRHYPDRAPKVLGRLREMRGGELSDPRFGSRMRGEGPLAAQIAQLFDVISRRHGLARGSLELSTAAFRKPSPDDGSPFRQTTIFDDLASEEGGGVC